MDLSMKWLAESVKVDVPPRKFAEAMTMSGSKVEGWAKEGNEIEGVVVGRVLSIKKHPDADTLVVCSVDVGGAAPLQIVTGATNLAAGDLVPAALDGASLPGGKQIHSADFRGVESQGMLCSLGELGLTEHDFPYADANGIFVLQEDCKPGDDIHAAIGLDDTVVEFEITPNRPDCLSVLGLAREASATFGVPFEKHEPKVEGALGDISELLSVTVENPRLCPRYVARVAKNVKIAPSPRWMRERLRASGVRPINNIVDITNYVMLEYGQPMHAFDISYVKGGKIIVRNARPGETLTTLDGVNRTLSPEMLVICDEEKPSAVAGVMGGEYSGINDNTNTIVFESANFLGASVRTTSRKLGLRTESSSRFEKGLDPMLCIPAVERACELVELLGAGEVVGGIIDVDHADHAPAVLTLEPDWINRFLGIDVDAEEMRRILRSLEFTVVGDKITVPSWRADVEHKADIAEEIARFYGYNKIPVTSIRGSAQGMLTEKQKFERRMVGVLIAQGLYEITTYTFVSPKTYDKLRLPADSPLRRSVEILNPLGEDTSVMRTTALGSMLDILSKNYNNRNPKAALFELAKEFIPGENADVLPTELEAITAGLYGEGFDYYSIKGVAEALLEEAGIRDFDVTPVGDNPVFHPGRCASISVNGETLGILGEVHPLVAQNYEINARCYLMRLSLPSLLKNAAPAGVYHPLPRYPASARDLALLCSDELPVQAIEKAIRAAVPDILESAELFDVYRGSQIPEGKKSLAFNLVLRAADRTLTDAEVSAAMDRALDAVKALGAELRS